MGDPEGARRGGMTRPEIRRRRDTDRAGCVALADQVQRADGYPVHRPEDLAAFVFVPDALAAWCAIEDDAIVGHVALHVRSSPEVVELASRTLGVAPARLGIVARLFVAPSHRRRGIGRRLLDTAAAEARARDLHPVLDVVTAHAEAIALYSTRGWRYAGAVHSHFSPDVELDELVFLGPLEPDDEELPPFLPPEGEESIDP
jgi:GNAT superfamily N-acetyltransferase